MKEPERANKVFTEVRFASYSHTIVLGHVANFAINAWNKTAKSKQRENCVGLFIKGLLDKK